jgi:hypothetical protein
MNPPQILHSEDVLMSHGPRSVLDFANRPVKTCGLSLC